METHEILYVCLYYYSVGPTFAFDTLAALSGMGSTSFEQSLEEFCFVRLSEHVEVAEEMLEVAICS
jgi:hypothetical protein